MCRSTGAYHDAARYAMGHNLRIHMVIEDNGLSTNTPTDEAWGAVSGNRFGLRRYRYERTYPHVGSGVFVPF
jgi:hypothetical protein